MAWGNDTTDSLADNLKKWKKPALRIGSGIQKSFYAEAGVSLLTFLYDPHEGFGTSAIYACFEWTLTRNVYGVKLGGEMGMNGGRLGTEFKYLWGDEREDFVLTLKTGLGVGLVSLFYGRNISFNKHPYGQIGKNQFSLVFNLTGFYFKKQDG